MVHDFRAIVSHLVFFSNQQLEKWLIINETRTILYTANINVFLYMLDFFLNFLLALNIMAIGSGDHIISTKLQLLKNNAPTSPASNGRQV